MRSFLGFCSYVVALVCCMTLYLVVSAADLYRIVLWDVISGVRGRAHRLRIYRWEMRWTMFIFMTFVRIMRITVRVRQPLSRTAPYPPAIVIANHRSAFDLFMLPAVLALFGYTRVRGIMKRQVAYMPVVGRASRDIGCAFVKRSGDPVDIERVKRCALGAAEDDACIAIFPEGTLYADPKVKTRSEVSYRHVLPPRAGGVRTLVETLPGHPVLSITIDWNGIPGATSVTNLYTMYGGTLDIGADFLDVPSGMPVRTWLEREWLRKDRLLSHEDAP